jgi:hypothetical protein
VWLDKRCLAHGKERVLLADDVEYWRRARELFLKPSEMPQRWNTPCAWAVPTTAACARSTSSTAACR